MITAQHSFGTEQKKVINEFKKQRVIVELKWWLFS